MKKKRSSYNVLNQSQNMLKKKTKIQNRNICVKSLELKNNILRKDFFSMGKMVQRWYVGRKSPMHSRASEKDVE